MSYDTNMRVSYSGAPGGSGDCTSCHTGSSSITGEVEISGIPEIILPGREYMIHVEVSSTTVFQGPILGYPVGGFQITSIDTGTSQGQGTFFDAPNTTLSNDAFAGYVSHDGGQDLGSDGKFGWTFPWIAPEGNPGLCFNFYLSSLLGDGDGGTNGDLTINKIVPVKMYTPMNLSINIVQDILCTGGDEGALTVEVSGGKAPFSYEWSNSANAKNISSLPSGLYSVTVTDALDEITSSSLELINPDPIELSVDPVNPVCAGASNGSIQINSKGGTPLFSYMWSNGHTTNQIDNLPVGNYTTTVSDANGCEAIESIILSEPDEIQISSTITSITCNGLSDGVISLSASGGIGNIDFQWSSGNSGSFGSSLPAGTYTITATDEQLCMSHEDIQLEEPQLLSIDLNPTPIACIGDSDGSIIAIPLGGTPPYKYKWDHKNSSQASLTDLGPGIYTVSITDDQLCKASMQVSIEEPLELEYTLNISNAEPGAYNNGIATILANGGMAPYTFNWSNGSTENQIQNLMPGSYQATVTDALGCSVILEAIIDSSSGTNSAQPLADQSMRIFPNPANQFIKIDLSKLNGTLHSISILDHLGKNVSPRQDYANNFQVNITTLPPGVYWIKGIVNQRIYIAKFIKQ